ncbi:MAG: tRNA epoxyqueuosine(34) reductase QueG [Marinilabiliaceae bacterium]|nr:tRNA epoxyqueuosine(34) reductase QueG [Marinilabiliaceae bacterium]
MINKEKISERIKEVSNLIGFDAIGFSAAQELTEDKERLQEWLERGFNADMDFMKKNIEKRLNPTLLEDGCLSVITVLKNYYPADSTLSTTIPRIARFAYGNDYHKVMKSKMWLLFSFIKNELFPQLKGRCFVDSAPVMERSLGVKAGLGWIGKNGMLINRKLGSYFFIGELFVNLELPYNKIEIKNGCGTCSRCIESCPVNAINENKTIDANKCISYHTIENKGVIPELIKSNLNGWIHGCDVCQETCPWNRFAKATNEPEFQPKNRLQII